jgi:hypothetical protein
VLTLTFAGEEAGDVSFAFSKGASRYFVVAVIATSQPDKLRQLLADVRSISHLPANYDFHFHELTSPVLRRRVFRTIAQADFESWAVIADKTSLPDSFRVMHGWDFYLYFVTEVIQLIPQNQQEGATVILDEFSSPTRLQGELRRVMRAREMPRHFKRVLVRRSQSEPLIQIADLMAGAILRRDAKDDPTTFESVQDKLKKLVEYRD